MLTFKNEIRERRKKVFNRIKKAETVRSLMRYNFIGVILLSNLRNRFLRRNIIC